MLWNAIHIETEAFKCMLLLLCIIANYQKMYVIYTHDVHVPLKNYF